MMTPMSATPRPVALVTAPFRGEGLETLRDLADVVLDPWITADTMRMYNAEQLAERARQEGATIVICESDVCAGPVMQLPLIAIGSTRGDPTNVDVPAATAAGIPVLRAPGRNADAVGDVWRGGTIPYQRYRAWQVAGQTVGLVGLGAVGRALRWRLEGLGMKVMAHDPYAEDAKHSLEEVLQAADVISLHAAVTPETEGLIGAAQFDQMRDGVVFLNTARAQLHDTDALVAALQSGKVAAAGLDHFVGEHLPVDHPLIGMDNVVLTPHIGGATYDTEANHSRLVADDLARLLTGERPVHIVNPEVLK